MWFNWLIIALLVHPAWASNDPFNEQYQAAKERGPVADANLRDCFHRSRGLKCQKASGRYLQKFDDCNSRGKCNGTTKKLVEGCYNSNFKRIADITKSTKKCENENAPFRVELTYDIHCPQDSFECISTGEIAVRIRIYNDADSDLPLGHDSNEIFRDLASQPILISSNQNGDPARVSCASMRPSGYVWNAQTNQCERPKPLLCQEVLGLRWMNGQCVFQNIDCETQFGGRVAQLCPESETKKYCQNYRFPASQTAPSACLCRGSQTTIDAHGRSCSGLGSIFYYEDPKRPNQKQSYRYFFGNQPGLKDAQ